MLCEEALWYYPKRDFPVLSLTKRKEGRVLKNKSWGILNPYHLGGAEFRLIPKATSYAS